MAEADKKEGSIAVDFLLHALARGQLIPAGLILIIVTILIKLPSSDVSWLLHGIVNLFNENPAFGYILFFVTLILSFIHGFYKKFFYEAEISRISEERNKLQDKLIPGGNQSSIGQR